MKQNESGCDDDMKWEVLASEPLFGELWLNARRERVRLPDGRIYNDYYVLHYPDWVNVIAITDDGHVLLERQYRHGIGQVSTEIVAGCVEPGEAPLAAAQRELMEETGYGGGTWTPLMTLTPNASTQDNHCHCFLAEGVTLQGKQHLDATEDIRVMLFTKEEVKAKLLNGEFVQAMMVAPLLKVFGC